ncbi:MAG: alkaline ceramidase [Frankiales bacterium]|nr:alkaline ceramidase [Frankiales bacterium]
MTDSGAPWLVGCGSADVTGEPWDAGMLGYGMRWQRSEGLHLRQRSRAFAVGDPATGRRLVLVVADVGMFFANVREAVLARLVPTGLRPEDLLLTATHTHAGAGGFSGYRMYATTNGGLREHTFTALVDGVVASVEQALADLAPGRLRLSRGELTGASVNRSPTAFARNPEADRQHFPDAVDPSTVLLRLEREGRLVGAVNWFATHGTSLSNRNTLLSGDNKGWASSTWEALLRDQGTVAAFAQTNAGDMSPNVPDATRGPTPDDVENTRLVGERQLDAALGLAGQAGRELAGGLDVRLSLVRLPGLPVDARHAADGRPHRLGQAVLGAAFAAGTKEGPGVGAFGEGVDGNRVLSACSGLAWRLRPGVGDAHRPKAMLLPVGALGWTAETVPVQIVRLGPLVLVALAQEVTIVAGLRLRRAVAETLEVPLEDVLLQGYANDYAGYVTTPEEYDAQRYEGGHTMFGRWLLPAYLQEVVRVATDLRDGRPSESAPPGRPKPVAPAAVEGPGPLATPRLSGPATARAGEQVRVEVAGDDPRGPVRAVYCDVQCRDDDGTWHTVATDADWSTTVRWRRPPEGGWQTVVRWQVPRDAAGPHRVRWCDRTGSWHDGPVFEVSGGGPPRVRG